MTRLVLAATLLSLTALGPLAAQEIPVLTETYELRIANIDVVVTDKKGNRVTGLTRDDFTIYENGVRQDLTNFSEIRSSAAPARAAVPAEVPPPAESMTPPAQPQTRYVILFIDLYSMHPFRRNEVFSAFERFVDGSLRPGDRIMLATWNRSLKVPLRFTDEHSAARSSLAVLSKEVSGGLARDEQIARRQIESFLQDARIDPRGARDFYARAWATATFFSDQQRVQSRELSIAFQNLARTTAGVSGKKVMLFASESLPQYPGIGMFEFVNETFQQFAAQIGRFGLPQASAGLNSQSGAHASIAAAANANGITIHAIYVGGSGESPAERTEPVSQIIEQMNFVNSAASMQSVSAETGGQGLLGSRNFDLALQTIALDLDNYYSLGYRMTGDEKGRRRVAVKAKNPALTARFRKSVALKSLEEEFSDRVVSNIYHQLSDNKIRIGAILGAAARRGRGKLTVPVTVTIPSDQVTLLPDGDHLTGGFQVFIGAGDESGQFSEVARKEQRVKITPAQKTALNGAPYTFSIDVVVRKGPGLISIAVIDLLTKEAGYLVEKTGV